jgi:hypothetical protein
MVRATVRMAREDETRGTTNVVNTLNAVEPTMKIPTISPATRRTDSISSSSHVVPGNEAVSSRR